MSTLSCYSSIKRTDNGQRPKTLPNFVDIAIAVDRSGSMHTMFEQTKFGLREFIKEQKQTALLNNVITNLTIKTFDNVVEVMPGFDNQKIEET